MATREAFVEQARALTPYLAATVGDEVFLFSTDDRGLGARLFVRQWRRDRAVLERVAAAFDTLGIESPERPLFVDVGANIGTTTITALKRHGFASAVAVEPSPHNYPVLRMNLIANGVDDRVRTVNAAASDVDGTVLFDISSARKNKGTHRIAAPQTSENDEGMHIVRSVTLDSLCDEHVEVSRVGMLWIDAQGHEPEVLLGASRLTEYGAPIVFTVWPDKSTKKTETRWRGIPEIQEKALRRLEASYTDAVVLGKSLTFHAVDELADVVQSFARGTEVLLVSRRPG